MKTNQLRQSVRDGIEAFDGSLRFDHLAAGDPAEIDANARELAAWGFTHGLVTAVLPVVAEKVRSIHTFDRMGCIQFISDIEKLLSLVATDARTIGIWEDKHLQGAVNVLRSYIELLNSRA